MSTNELVDAVVVGAGAAGAFLAARLAAAGRSVVVFEAGPDWRLEDLHSSQIWARRLKWGGAPVERGGEHPFGHNMGVGWGMGGSALHHYAGWPRLLPEDFRTRTRYGRGRDWPIDYDVLRPHYDRIQKEMGICGDAAREPWRPPGDPYPMPPLPAFPQGDRLAAGFAKVGMRVAPAPLAINSVPYDGRAACIYDGWCDAGCPIGALANPLVTHIPRAKQAGARFVTDTQVTRILCSDRRRVHGVDAVNARGERRVQLARMVILAAAPVQNVRLLLNSASEVHDRGIGNETGQVGRHFSCHMVTAVFGRFDEPMHNHLGVSAGQLISQEHYAKTSHGSAAFGSSQWGLAPALKPNDLLGIANSRADLFGERLRKFLEEDGPRLASMSSLCEVVNEGDSRIELAEKRDQYGAALARIVNTLSPSSLALAKAVTDEGLAVMRAAGSKESWTGPMAAAHPLGGTIMGDDPRTSVTDSYGRVHSVDNLFIAGGGLFPTAGGGSPTFTIYALANRAVEQLLDAA